MLDHLCNLFFGIIFNAYLYSEFRFLSLVQALEGYSRAFHIGQYMADEDYEVVKAALIAAIPPQTNPDLRSSLRDGKIKYGNEHSLRKRLREILGALEDDTVDLVCSRRGDFCEAIVATRNYLTHYTSTLKSQALSGGDLYWATERMKLLLTILLLKELNIDETRTREMVMANGTIHHLSAHHHSTGIW